MAGALKYSLGCYIQNCGEGYIYHGINSKKCIWRHWEVDSWIRQIITYTPPKNWIGECGLDGQASTSNPHSGFLILAPWLWGDFSEDSLDLCGRWTCVKAQQQQKCGLTPACGRQTWPWPVYAPARGRTNTNVPILQAGRARDTQLFVPVAGCSRG